MSLDKTLEDALRELFSRIEVNVRLEDSHPMVEGTTVMTAPGQSFTLRGDAYRLLQHIADTIAESASLKGGLSLKEAEALVLLACTQFLDQGETVALVGLDSKFQAAPHRWTVIRPAPVFHQAKEVAIGPCRFQRGLPPLPIPAEPFIKQRFPAFTVAVDVEARGPEGAMLMLSFGSRKPSQWHSCLTDEVCTA